MAFRLEVRSKIPDARSVSKRAFFNSLIGKGKVSTVAIVEAYTVDAKLNPAQIQKAAELLANPLTEISGIKHPVLKKGRFDYAVEISFLPGVTDNLGRTAREGIEDATKYQFKPRENVYSSRVFFISGRLSRGHAKKIAAALHNPLIQKAVLLAPPLEFPPNLPKVKLSPAKKVLKVDLNISLQELVKLGKLGIRENHPPHSPLILKEEARRRGPLALDLDSLRAIRDYFNKLKRKPADAELEMLAQTWSEHCKHAIFADPMDNLKQGLFKTYIRAATEAIRRQKGGKDFCVSVFADNAGAIAFDKDFLITHKVETHNTPSALDPFGGAVTGIGGVNRDALGFGLGAKPIINTYGFCLAPPKDKTKLYRDKLLRQPMLSAKRIMDGVIAGINAGGNQSGIPTSSGFMYFDPRFRGKPLVFAGTVGLIPRKIKGRLSHAKSAQPGDCIVMIGGRVGLDGIHGATFSSEGLNAHSPAAAVQIGDPITQKKFSDAIVKEARGLGLYNSITDCGAGGLSSAVGEMALQSGGCEVNLDKAPVKYPGLAPWQIWISESQERMVLAVPPKNWRKFRALMKKRGVGAAVIGKFTNSGKCAVKLGKTPVVDLDMDFLHNGRPVRKLKSQSAKLKITIQKSGFPQSKNYNSQILSMLSRLNIAGTEFLAAQYDHEVQGGSALKPLQGKGRVNAEATVTRPILTSKKGIVLSYGLYPSYSEINPYQMAACAIDTAIRNSAAAGADAEYLALLDNFCWCSSSEPKRLWQLKEAARACYDYAVSFGTPFISGKDSMFNDFQGYDSHGQPIKISIPPTLLISAIGVMPDAYKAVSLDAKLPGDVIYILGKTHDELAGSEYSKIWHKARGMEQGAVPAVDAAANSRLYKALFKAIQNGLVASAISVGRGGLAIAFAKMLIAGQLGAEISLSDLPGSWQEYHQALFSESQGRLLVSVNPKKSRQFESSMKDNALARLGTVGKKNKLTISGKTNKKIVNLTIRRLTRAYHSTFKGF